MSRFALVANAAGIMRRLVVLAPFLLLSANLRAQERAALFFAAPVVELTGYGRDGASIGGGLALGGGDGVGMGVRVMYFTEPGDGGIDTLEITVFMRFYPLGGNVPQGFFFQVEAGPAVFVYRESLALPAVEDNYGTGCFAAGVTAGWRFWLGRLWYVEPYLRAGYPYIAGGGVSAGLRF